MTIVDVIDQNRALVDGTPSGVPRQPVQFKRLRLTKFVLPIAFATSSKNVKKQWAEAKIDEKYAATKLAKQLASQARKASLTDFERFKLYKTKQQVSEW